MCLLFHTGLFSTNQRESHLSRISKRDICSSCLYASPFCREEHLCFNKEFREKETLRNSISKLNSIYLKGFGYKLIICYPLIIGVRAYFSGDCGGGGGGRHKLIFPNEFASANRQRCSKYVISICKK